MEKQIYFALLLAVVCVDTGMAIKCYICNSQIDRNCSDPFDGKKFLPQTCTPQLLADTANKIKTQLPGLGSIVEAVVFKPPPMVCQKIENEVNGERITSRLCQVDDTTTDVCHKLLEEKSLKVSHCSVCREDLCNAAPMRTDIPSLASYFVITCVLGAIWARITS